MSGHWLLSPHSGSSFQEDLGSPRWGLHTQGQGFLCPSRVSHDLEMHGPSWKRTSNIFDTQGRGRINKSPLDTARLLLAFGVNEFLHLSLSLRLGLAEHRRAPVPKSVAQAEGQPLHCVQHRLIGFSLFDPAAGLARALWREREGPFSSSCLAHTPVR